MIEYTSLKEVKTAERKDENERKKAEYPFVIRDPFLLFTMIT